MSTRFKIKWKISADEILKFDLSSDKIDKNGFRRSLVIKVPLPKIVLC